MKGDTHGSCSSSAPRSRIAPRRSPSLRDELLIAGPIALLVATGAGYLLAGLSLRPVDSMRRQAALISAERPGERLPVPHTRDEVERLGETLNAMLGRLEAALARERDFVADAGPRAADAACAPANGARAGAPACRLGGGAARGRAALVGGGRPAGPARRGSAAARPLARRRPAAAGRVDRGRGPPHAAWRAASSGGPRRRAGRSRLAAGRASPPGRSAEAGTGSRQPRRQRAALRRGRRARLGQARERDGGAARDRRGGGVPAGVPRRGRSSASRATTTPGRGAARAWGSRSSARSPRRTAAARTPAGATTRGRRVADGSRARRNAALLTRDD